MLIHNNIILYYFVILNINYKITLNNIVNME